MGRKGVLGWVGAYQCLLLQPGEECVIGGKVADQGLLLHAGGGGVDSLVGGDLGLLLTDG